MANSMHFLVEAAGQVLVFKDSDGSNRSVELLQEEIAQDSYGLTKLDLKPGDVVFDVGAHIGTVSIILAKLYPGIKIYAFEPAARTFEFLLDNIESNGVNNITAFNLAIDGESKELSLMFNPNDTCGSSASYNEEIRGLLKKQEWVEEKIQCITLEEAFKLAGVDRVKWLKLDCEGSEYGIFKKENNFLNRVDRISMELHVPYSRLGEGKEALIEEFANYVKLLEPRPKCIIVNMNYMHDVVP